MHHVSPSLVTLTTLRNLAFLKHVNIIMIYNTDKLISRTHVQQLSIYSETFNLQSGLLQSNTEEVAEAVEM